MGRLVGLVQPIGCLLDGKRFYPPQDEVNIMEQLNHLLFAWINATPASPEWLIDVATFLARDLIIIVPALIIGLWLWGPQSQLVSQREVVAKTTIALLFAMLAAATIAAPPATPTAAVPAAAPPAAAVTLLLFAGSSFPSPSSAFASASQKLTLLTIS